MKTKKILLTAAVLTVLSVNVYAAETVTTLANNHTAESGYNLVSGSGNNKVVTDSATNQRTVNNVILGGWSKYQGENIYNIFSGTEISSEKRNVENIVIGDVVKIKDADYSLMIGNHISNENDKASIEKYGRRSTMIKGDNITVKNSPHATVLGQYNTVTNSYGAFVHGKDAVVENATWSVVMGQGASAKLAAPLKGASVVIGQGANTDSNFTIAIGANASAKNYAATAIGGVSEATGKYSLAMAQGIANGEGALSIGMNAVADKNASVSLGVTAKSMADRAVAIGYGATATTNESIAMGTNSKVSGTSGVSIGRDNNVTGDDSVVVGANNGTVAGVQSAVIGYNNKVSARQEQLVFGSNSESNGQGALVFGTHAKSLATDAVAFGNNTVADQANSIALGTNSTTDTVVSTDHIYINGNKYNFAGGKADSTVSVGATNKAGASGVENYKRTITNVAAGRIDANSTDAVNGSQLNAVINSLKFTTVADGKNTTVAETTNIDGGKEFSVNVNKDLYNMSSINFGTNNSVSLTDKGLNNGGNTITNVKAGVNNTDAVNVSQLKEVKDKTVINESRINDLDNRITDVGRNALNQANHYTDLQVNKGVAKASALAGLKFLDYNPKDKWSFAASVGHYRNANAVAVGAAYQPNENTMVHGGITVDGKVAYNLGVSFKTGGQKYINKYELADKVKQLESDNAELRQELNELRSMIDKK